MAKGNNVRQIAQGHWPFILTALGIDEMALTGKHGPCPLCGGNDRFRFDDKEGRGTYYCSGCGAGDGMRLALCFTGQAFKELAQTIENLASAVPATTRLPGRSNVDKCHALRQVWKGSKPIQRGDVVERYLQGRGLMLPNLPTSVRVHPELQYRDDDQNLVGLYAAMLATVTDSIGNAVTLHRTYLENSQKAPVRHPKKLMQGLSIAGAAIRLFPASGTLGIAEGIETALAAAEMFRQPVWSCISAGGIESFIPPDGIRDITIFADHDLNFTGQAAAYRAAHRLALKGYAITVKIPDTPGDWLDELRTASSVTTERKQ